MAITLLFFFVTAWHIIFDLQQNNLLLYVDLGMFKSNLYDEASVLHVQLPWRDVSLRQHRVVVGETRVSRSHLKMKLLLECGCG